MASFVEHPLIKPMLLESRPYQEVLRERVRDNGNTLVVAPTALGKTVVAVLLAADMLDQDPDGKILFLAPTKPLAVQHEQSFRKFMNLNGHSLGVLTGTTPEKERKRVWEQGNFIAATPQTIEGMLRRGHCSMEGVRLVIFDEAHRAVSNYSYVYLARKYMRDCTDPLILALTASPGSSEEKISDVCRNLFIKNIEIKHAEDADVKPHTNEMEMEWVKIPLPPEFKRIQHALQGCMKEQLLTLKKLGYARTISSKYFGKRQLLDMQTQIRKDLVRNGERKPSLYLAASRAAALLKVSHAHTLLETQGIGPLADYFQRMQASIGTRNSTKAAQSILKDAEMQEAIALVHQLKREGVTHPKIAHLKKILQKQFSSNPGSKVLVFNHYRDSVKYLEKELRGEEGIKVTRFVGQAARGMEKGMTQKEQKEILDALREGIFNTLIATSVAEEGLDIPSVDLVVFFEPVPSEIRMIQRRGRTGRFGKGKTVILMAEGTQDEAFYWASISKERKMQQTLHAIKDKPNSHSLAKQSTLVKYANGVKDKVLVYVDTREQNSVIARQLEEMGALVKIKQLEVGDYVVSDHIVIERKTTEDFLNSILDGRLFNQMVKMTSNYDSPLILVEGDKNELFALRNIHRNAIIGALTSIAVNYRLPVLFCDTPKETAEYIYVTAKREQLAGTKDIRLRVGRKGISLPQKQRFVAESLPAVGPTLARKLLQAFGSLKALVNADITELRKVEKIGEKKAREITQVLQAPYEEQD